MFINLEKKASVCVLFVLEYIWKRKFESLILK